MSRDPAVAFILQAWRLASENWPFPLVAAILRSSLFRPNWPEVQADPEVAACSETLLRMLGETRGRDTYLQAVRIWEQAPPEALEDEVAEESVRQRKQQLARRCRPFLERFFATWDRLKSMPLAQAAVAQFRDFAAELGVGTDRGVSPGLARFWHELERWARSESTSFSKKALRAERFLRVLSTIASVPCRSRSSSNCGGVSLLSAETAAGIDCDYLFLIGLGEGSWPNLSPETSLLDDAERERLRSLGLPLADPSMRLAFEQYLFVKLVTTPRRGLVLSYSATDDRGNSLLPGTFLRELLKRFPGIDKTSQRMLLDGYFDHPPLGPAELRVQIARSGDLDQSRAGLPETVRLNLRRAAAVVRARFENKSHGPFDGLLRHPAVIAELNSRYSAEKVFSPTSLETYIACPFRFLLKQVLRLEPLCDPTEEVESTRRGSAVHRALARFHARLRDLPRPSQTDELPKTVGEELDQQMQQAVEEYAQRAPSRATAELWRLEGKRLARAARRYRGQWQAFRKPWQEVHTIPQPFRFEADFGMAGDSTAESLVIKRGDIEVRIGGRIDRIDCAEIGGAIGFWIIDYKTGRGTQYQASQVERLEKLQLPLYALAVERVLFKDKPARPLGLAYWLVTDAGPKPVLAKNKTLTVWLGDPAIWKRYCEQLEGWIATLASGIRSGDFPLSPRSQDCTDSCDFGSVCRIAQCRNTGKASPLSLPVMTKS